MFSTSTISIYGGKPSPTYIGQAGTNLVIPMAGSLWSTNIKNGVKWSQFGRSSVYPAISVNNAAPGSVVTDSSLQATAPAKIGNNTLVVLNGFQFDNLSDRVFCYYLKAGIPYTLVTVNQVTNILSPKWVNSSLAFGNGIFVAGGRYYNGAGTTTPSIIYSTNGINWTALQLTSGFSAGTEVMFDNGFFYANYDTSIGVGPPITVMYRSTDGINWTSFSPPTLLSDNWLLKAANTRLFASRQSPQANYISTNQGASWTNFPYHNGTIQSDVFANSVYLTITGLSVNETSPDNLNWTTHTNTLNLLKVSVIGGKFVAVDKSGLKTYESTNGVSWTQTNEAIISRSEPVTILSGNL